MIHELSVFPQWTLSDGQGLVGVRRWTLDPDNDLDAFVTAVCESHWPGNPDCIPVQVQVGSFFDETVIKTPDNPRTIGTLGDLLVYGKTQVVAQYALQRMTNCWPQKLGNKPYHPAGTTMTCRVRGSGQFILLAPAGLRAVGMDDTDCSDMNLQQGIGQSANTRVLIPTTEYLLTCDRMTRAQVDEAMKRIHWDLRIGTVNDTFFLNADPGTLLFESWEMDETFVPHTYRETRLRYRLTCVLRSRLITDEGGSAVIPINEPLGNVIAGWNQDFILQGVLGAGWYSVKTIQADGCKPRYPADNFGDMFVDAGSASGSSCGLDESDGSEYTDPCKTPG